MKNLETLIQELCPDGVEFVKLGDCCSFKRGTTITAKNAIPGDVPVLAGGQKPAYYHNEANRTGEAIVVAGSGAYAGFVSYWTIPVFLSDSFSVEPDDRLVVKFVYYFLKNIQQKIFATKKGSGVPHVHGSSIEKFEIPLPPIEVQTEIVRILDKFTLLEAELETELETELDCRKRQYEYYRDKLLSFNNEGGQEVEWKKMSEVCEIYDGTHQTPKYQTEGIPFISVENIKDIYGSNKYISIEAYEAYKVKPKVGDVFMTRIGSIGACAVFTKQEDVAYYVSLALLRPNSAILDSRFLKHLIESSIGKRELSKRTLHNAVPIKINKSDIGKIKLPVPSLSEQERMANILDRFESLTTSLQSGLPAEIAARRQQYEHYRDKLLTFKRKGAA